ncbi:MAG: GerMN domain-containing protein [Acidimicrobiales bacterium]
MRRLAAATAVAVAAVALAGCTLVPTATEPTAIAPRSVPLGLLGRTIPGTNHGHVVFITQPVYIVDATGHLSASSRIVPRPPTLLSVLRELVLGPTTIETEGGYTSDLPADLTILQAVIVRHLGYIDLAQPFTGLRRHRVEMIMGQLTLTAYAVGATSGVKILVNGSPLRVPRPSGPPVVVATVRDYQSLLNA